MWEYFHTLLHPLRLSPGLSSSGLEEPWKGKHAAPASFSICVHWTSASSANPNRWQTFTSLSWGHRRPHRVSPQSPSCLTFPLLSSHRPAQAAVWLNPSRYKLTQILEIFPIRPEVSGGAGSFPGRRLSRRRAEHMGKFCRGPSVRAEALCLHHCWEWADGWFPKDTSRS